MFESIVEFALNDVYLLVMSVDRSIPTNRLPEFVTLEEMIHKGPNVTIPVPLEV